MITQVSETDFIDAFQAIRPDSFTYNGLKALYAYLEDLSDDIGEEFKLDVIGICCEFPISEEFTAMDINGIMSSNKNGFIIQSF